MKTSKSQTNILKFAMMAALALPLLAPPATSATVIVKAGNADDLSLGSSWVGGAIPTTTDTAVWNAPGLGGGWPGTPNSFSSDLSWAGLRNDNSSGGMINISSPANTLTLGAGGITNDQIVLLNCNLAIGSDQTWCPGNTGWSAIVQQGTMTGTAPLNITGQGTILMQGDNSGYSGNLTFGPLYDVEFQSLTAFGVNNTVTFSNVSTLKFLADYYQGGTFQVDGTNGLLLNAANRFLVAPLSGSGTLNIANPDAQVPPQSTDKVVSFQGWTGSSGFTGTINMQKGTLWFTSANMNDAVQINLTGDSLLHAQGYVGRFDIGAISGGPSSFLEGGNGAVDFWVGGANLATEFAGTVRDGFGDGGVHPTTLVKIGTNVWTLSGNNTYSGITLVIDGQLWVNNTIGSGTGTNSVTVQANAMLGGVGIIGGPVTIADGGVLSAGTNSIGTLTLQNSLNLQGTTLAEINRNGTPKCDKIAVTGTINYGGTLVVNNLGSSVQLGDSFTLFTAGSHLGSFANLALPATPSGTHWVFTNGVLSVVASALPSPAHLTNTLSGGNLILSWPSGNGWRLQAQTNTLNAGLTTNWSDVAGSQLTNTMSYPVNTSKGSVFFRLITP